MLQNISNEFTDDVPEWLCGMPDGGIVVFDEEGTAGWSVKQHMEEVKARNERHGRTVTAYFGDPQEVFSNRAQGSSVAAQAQACGFRFAGWPATAKAGSAQMVNMVRECLIAAGRSAKQREDQPYLQVCRRCKMTIAEYQTWSYKRSRDGEMSGGDDQFEDKDNHSFDCIRGVISHGFFQRMHEAMQRAKSRPPDPLEDSA